MTKLLKYRTIKGTLTCISGLRIGGTKDDIEIGSMENPIIRDPLTNLPYVPGSSIKGKTRALLELAHDKVSRSGEPCGCGNCDICRIFGPHKNVRHNLGPTRIIVRDAHLTPQSKEDLLRLQEAKGLLYAEVKTENIVNRLTGVAADRGLRTQERVPAGTVFDFEVSVRIFDQDKEDDILAFIEEGLKLLQQDYLGGSGSRGYGKIELDYEVS